MSSRHRHIYVALQMTRKVRAFVDSSTSDALQLLRPRRTVHITQLANLPPVPAALKDNSRWLQVTILNQTHFRLQYIDTYFSFGEYYDLPTDVPPLSDLTFSCFSNEFLAGCGGGVRFRIHLGDGTFHDFAIGWINPPIGHYKSGVIFDRSPRVACECASACGDSMISQWRWEKDVDGRAVAFRLRVSAEPGPNAVFLVEEVTEL